jgi:uncharacterized RDD family membrane protein YckC
VSTLHTANLFPSWKQEVNRRVADHLSRRNASAESPDAEFETHLLPKGRAAQAAARVAARFANAPSYNQMLAEEARAAMRAAQAAHKAAEHAHAAVQMVLAGIEAAASTQPARDFEAVPARESMTTPDFENPQPPVAFHEARSAADCSESDATSEIDRHISEHYEAREQEISARAAALAAGSIPIQHAEPLHANLIQFPREMVATRRLRPRRIEGPLAAFESVPQLSIFEVDPAAISTQPSAPVAEETAAPTWMRPEWPAIELERTPEQEIADEPVLHETPLSTVVDLAPVNKRLISIAVDGCLTIAAFAGVLALAARIGALLHNLRAFEICAAILLLLVCAGYQTLCFYHARATLGMMYAGVALCTVDGYRPTREQRLRRLLMLPLSVLPLGLGLAWSVFDEDRLTWHDRLSGTYLRER